VRLYLRSFDWTPEGMGESKGVETGEFVRTSDYLLMRREAEAEIERFRQGIEFIRTAEDLSEVKFLVPVVLNPDMRIVSPPPTPSERTKP
jgi:hypothetical protein